MTSDKTVTYKELRVGHLWNAVAFTPGTEIWKAKSGDQLKVEWDSVRESFWGFTVIYENMRISGPDKWVDGFVNWLEGQME